MKFILKKTSTLIAAAILVTTNSLLYSIEEVDSAKTEVPKNPEKKVEIDDYSFPFRWKTFDHSPFLHTSFWDSSYFNVDLLAWKSTIGGLQSDFGGTSVVETSSDDVLTTTIDQINRDPGFCWNTGFRIGVGQSFDFYAWDIKAFWTCFNGHANWANSNSRGNWHVKLNSLDILLSNSFYTSGFFSTKPFLGIRSAWIRQNLRSGLVTSITSSSGASMESIIHKDNQKFSGFGPIIGVEGDLNLGYGFGFYGNAAASILYGHFTVKLNETDTLSTGLTVTNGNKKLSGVNYAVDAGLGVRWLSTIGDNWLATLKLGYEHHGYFDQNQLADYGNLSFDGLTLSVVIDL